MLYGSSDRKKQQAKGKTTELTALQISLCLDIIWTNQTDQLVYVLLLKKESRYIYDMF